MTTILSAEDRGKLELAVESAKWIHRRLGPESAEARRIASALIEILSTPPTETEEGWIRVEDRLPAFEKSVLLFWEKTKHVEDGTIYEYEEVAGKWYHVLFDGESLNDEPSHWRPLPSPPLDRLAGKEK